MVGLVSLVLLCHRFFVSPKFFLVSISWARNFFLLGISWVQIFLLFISWVRNFLSCVFRESKIFPRGYFFLWRFYGFEAKKGNKYHEHNRCGKNNKYNKGAFDLKFRRIQRCVMKTYQRISSKPFLHHEATFQEINCYMRWNQLHFSIMVLPKLSCRPRNFLP